MVKQQTRKLEMEVMGVLETTGDLAVKCMIGKSQGVFFIDTDGQWVNIFYVSSKQKGDMKKMIDFVVNWTGISWCKGLSPLGDNFDIFIDELEKRLPHHLSLEEETENARSIYDAIDWYTEVEDEYAGDTIDMLVFEWDVERGSGESQDTQLLE